MLLFNSNKHLNESYFFIFSASFVGILLETFFLVGKYLKIDIALPSCSATCELQTVNQFLYNIFVSVFENTVPAMNTFLLLIC